MKLNRARLLMSWVAPTLLLLGMTVVTPSVAFANGNSTNSSDSNHNQNNNNQNNNNKDQGNHTSDNNTGDSPSVPETPYAVVFPIALAGLALVVYLKRKKTA